MTIKIGGRGQADEAWQTSFDVVLDSYQRRSFLAVEFCQGNRDDWNREINGGMTLGRARLKRVIIVELEFVCKRLVNVDHSRVDRFSGCINLRIIGRTCSDHG